MTETLLNKNATVVDPDNIGLTQEKNQFLNISNPYTSNSTTSNTVKIKRNVKPKKLIEYEKDDCSREISNKIKTKDKRVINKLYVCTFEGCYKQCHDNGSLRKHLWTHGEKQYTCKACNKKFLDKSKLRRHSWVHSKEKPFRCDICDKKFSLDFNWRTHKRIHTGEKPYACVYPGCFKRFSQSSNWSAHEKAHKLWASFWNNNNNKDNNKDNNFNNIKESLYTYEHPIFTKNPLLNWLSNNFAGTLSINNWLEINSYYDYIKNKQMKVSQPPDQSMRNNSVNEIGRNLYNGSSLPFITKTADPKKITPDTNNSNSNNIRNSQSWNKNNLFVISKAKPLFLVKTNSLVVPPIKTDTYANSNEINLFNNKINFINSNISDKYNNNSNIGYYKSNELDNLDNEYIDEITYGNRMEIENNNNNNNNNNNIIFENEDIQNIGEVEEQNIEDDDIGAGYFGSRNW